MSEISEEATRLIDNFEYAVQDAVSDYMMAGGASYKNQARYNLEDYIAELEAAQRWIPVSERLPEEDTDGNTLMAICRHSGEWVRAPFGAEFADEFVRHYTHWMYAPQPPEVQE